MSNFYAVLKGRVPGVYTDWNECKKQTDGFSGPVFRKFPSRVEAEKFILLDPSRSYPSSSSAKLIPKKEEPLRKNIIEFVRVAFNMTIKLFKVTDETIVKIATAIWEDIESADENNKDAFQHILKEYLPVADCFYNKEYDMFLDEQRNCNSIYRVYINSLKIAYINDGGKKFLPNKEVEITFDDEDDESDEMEEIEGEEIDKDEKKIQTHSITDLTSVLYTDGAHNKTTGSEAWGSVVNKRGEDVMEDYQQVFTDMITKIENLPVGTRRVVVAKFNDVASQQINGAELLALIIGLRLALFSKGQVKTIMCDSKLMTEYWSKNLKKESRERMDPRKAKYVDELICLRKEFETMGGKIEKISGDYNKSDLGFHKKK